MTRPRVIANFALSADGKVSTRKFVPTGFTSPTDKRRLQEIRSRGDALLAGAATVRTDHMSMRLTDPALRQERLVRGQTPEPLRVMVSNRGNLDRKGKVFASAEPPLVVFSTGLMPDPMRSWLSRRADLWLFEGKTVALAAMLSILRKDYDVRTLVCEGGPTLFRALLEIGAVDELYLTWAPVVFGGAGAPTLTGPPGSFLPETVTAKLLKMDVAEDECFLHYRIRSLRGLD